MKFMAWWFYVMHIRFDFQCFMYLVKQNCIRSIWGVYLRKIKRNKKYYTFIL